MGIKKLNPRSRDRDIKDISDKVNELIDNIEAKPSPRNAIDSGLRLVRVENKQAVIEAVVDGVKYQTLMYPASRQGRNRETSPRVVPRVKRISASTDNVNVKEYSVLVVESTSGSVVIGGFVGGTHGQVLFLAVREDTSYPYTNTVTLENLEAGNDQQIYTPTGSDWVITGRGGATLVFDIDDNKWHIIGGTGA